MISYLYFYLVLMHSTSAQKFDPMQRWGYVNIPGWTCVDDETITGCDISQDCQTMNAQCFQSTIYTIMWYSNVNPCCYPKTCYSPTPNPGIASCSWQSCASSTFWSTSSAVDGGCTACPAGSRCPGDFYSYLCIQGTYSTGGTSECTLCPPGTANPVEGQSSCPQCLSNYYSPGGIPECIPCSPGTESNPGASSCSPIPTPSATTTSSSTSTSSSSNTTSPSPSFSSSISYSSTKSLSSSSSFTSSPSLLPQIASSQITQRYQAVIGGVSGSLALVAICGWSFAAYLGLRLRNRKGRKTTNQKSIKISNETTVAMGDIYTLASEKIPLVSSITLQSPLLVDEKTI